MKRKFRLTLDKRELQKIHDLVRAELADLVRARAPECTTEFVGVILDKTFLKLSS